MGTRRYSDTDILDMLLRLDAGTRLSEREMHALSERTSLSLRDIIALPESLGQLQALQRLDLIGTNITKLPESLGRLQALQELNLRWTRITKLPESLGRLQALQWLDLSHTNITALPESLGQLQALQRLDLCSSKITKLPESLGQLQALQRLDLSVTRITKLPESLGQLPALRYLNLSHLKLDQIPRSLAHSGLPFYNYNNIFSVYLHADAKTGIILYDTTLSEQDVFIFVKHPELIPSLYEDQVTLRECKVIFLGDGESGKSYTIARFLNEGKKETPEHPYVTSKTPGVEIKDYHVKRENFDIHFWDFGGQQLLHAMHRCFLTEETCYVVMVKTRNTDANRRARFWLRNVNAFAPDSPVLLFVNCWEDDDGGRAIAESALRRDFPNIKEVVYCSAMNAETEDFRRGFMDRLVDLAAHSEGCTRTINAKWDALRQAIRREQKTKEVLTREDYFKLCRENGIEDGNEAGILTFFNNLGICFSYHRDRARREVLDYRLLQPVWLTNALYAVIEEGWAAAQEGRIRVSAIEQMLINRAPEWIRDHPYKRTRPDLEYQKEHIPYILAVAEQHELCYAIDGDRMFFPALCDADHKDAAPETDYPQHIAYRLKYSYLPDSVVHRLMIRCLRRKLTLSAVWLHGLAADGMDNRCRAVVHMNDDEALDVDVYSRDDPAFDLFSLLRAELQEVNNALGLTAKEFIMDGTDAFALQTLLSAYRDNCKVYSDSGEVRDPGELLGRTFTGWDLYNFAVRGRTIVLNIPEREYHPRRKDDRALRYALYEAYHRTCPYCKQPFRNFEEFQVDHILPEKWGPAPELRPYLDYLRETGFDLDMPDYIENYFPAHPSCNRSKTNSMDIFTLPFRHEVAARRTKQVLGEIKKYKEPR